MISEGLAAIAIALVSIFCTPFGWIGIICFGFAINMIIGKNKCKEN